MQPPRDDNGEQDIILATELATDLLLHFQYVRLLIYDVVDKNPFHVLQPRHAWTEKGSCIVRTMHFQKYLRGLVETIKGGSVVQRGLLLGEVYARKFEDYITWPEFECVLAHGHTLSQVSQHPTDTCKTRVHDGDGERILLPGIAESESGHPGRLQQASRGSTGRNRISSPAWAGVRAHDQDGGLSGAIDDL